MQEGKEPQVASPATEVDAEGETLAEASPGPGIGVTPGAKVGRYSVLELLGSGGMGSVYAAYDPVLDRRIALKVIRQVGDSAVADEPGQARLLREAQALAKLNHPNIVSVYDVENAEGKLHIAMEYVEGQDLRRWLQASPRSTSEIIEVFVKAGQALQAAHDTEIVHRDFKPENVLVTKDGSVRVIDFGIARLLAGVSKTRSPFNPEATMEEQSARGLQRLETEVGMVLGTPAYMALEQFYGDADPRTDQFSFAVCLYEALFGHSPYGGKTLDERIDNLESGRCIDPGEAPELVPAARKALMRALRAQARDRFPSMNDLLEHMPQANTSAEEMRLREIGRANDQGLESRQRAIAGMAASVFLIAVISVLYGVNRGSRTAYTPLMVFYIALILWLGVTITLMRFREAFMASEYNRRWALMLWATPTVLLVHRASALLGTQTSTEIIQTDVFLLATCMLMFAHFSRAFYGVSAILATMACISIVDPSLARLFLNGGGLLFAGSIWMVWHRKRRN